ncbi:MFS transporter [Kocuria rosea]|uniref:DHA2 family efflux MFS transporter permease subunit n=1 Tax=Kocuria rosea TaxID=1275 RepID=UPI000D64EC3C|nr:DHA2 family efflux MFS transporter permease subunit [Kocuria rosea]PWF82703.1 MFS transporter [Kocuria rosea]QCY32979.1 DHA2 family efflux MFS transporter permease subunit [Kocuria rosea]TQN33627.1 DHA2 family lincomycin resistance protein-like MFS transporter [Kocuria rosea]
MTTRQASIDPQPDTEPPVLSTSQVVDARDKLAPGDGLVLGLLMASTFIVLLNEMLLGVALPTLIEELAITATTGQWLTTGYLLTLAVLIPATGFVMRKFHLRTVFLTAMSLFTAGTVLAALAPGFGVLFTGRIIQAIGTAVFLPLLMATTMRLVPAARQGRFMALVVIVSSAAPALGPAVSGLVLSQLSWRWLFLLMVPVALTGLVLGAVKLRNITTPEPIKLDVLSLVLSAAGFGALVYGLATIGESTSGHTPVSPSLPILVGVLGVAAFVLRQRALQRTDDALLDVRIFAVKSFTVPLLVMLALTMTAFGTGVVFPLLLSSVSGLGTLQIGLFLVPGGITIAVVSASGGRLYDRLGPRPLAVPGALIVAASLWFLSRIDSGTAVSTLLIAYITMIIGQALMWSPLTTAALSALPAHLYPHGSAAFGTIQQLGGAAGTAVLVSAYTLGSTAHGTGPLDLAQSVSAAQAAFTAAAVVASASALATLFVRRPRSVDPHTPAEPTLTAPAATA